MKTQIQEFNRVVKTQLGECADRFDYEYIKPAVELITECVKNGGRLHITGLGKPYHVASYMCSLISSIGTPCYLLDCVEAVHGSSGQVASGDVVICISYYGVLAELERTMKTLRNNGAKLIAVTGFEESNVAKLADIHLLCHVEKEGDALGRPPRTSMLATMLLMMDISLALQLQNDMTPEKYVKFHPGGVLGEI